MKTDSRSVCLRFGPKTAGSSPDAPWSHPIEATFPSGLDRHVAIPVTPPKPQETAKPGEIYLATTRPCKANASVPFGRAQHTISSVFGRLTSRHKLHVG